MEEGRNEGKKEGREGWIYGRKMDGGREIIQGKHLTSIVSQRDTTFLLSGEKATSIIQYGERVGQEAISRLLDRVDTRHIWMNEGR